MASRTLSTICFDWDGTLCDSGAASLRAFRKSLGEFGCTFSDAEYKRVYTPRWYRMYAALGLPESCWPQADQNWLRHYREEEPGLVPGAAAVLEALAGNGWKLGIVTNGTRERVCREIGRLGLAKVFQALVCCEDVVEKKPHPEGLEKALLQLAETPQSCCYVGDTAEDVLMGRNAGAFTVGILTDYVDPEGLRASLPDAVLVDIGELTGLLTSSAAGPG